MAACIKKGDVVMAVCGDDKGKTGRVLQLLSGNQRAVVEGLNMVKKHMRKTQDNPQGGVFDKEASIHISNLKKQNN